MVLADIQARWEGIIISANLLTIERWRCLLIGFDWTYGMPKRSKMPSLSTSGHHALSVYEQYLYAHEDLSQKTIRNYLSDLRQFMAWCDDRWTIGELADDGFLPTRWTTPLLTRYRFYLQHTMQLQPNSINRSLISIKRYCGWCVDQGLLSHNPAAVVKLVPAILSPPRHLSDQEEEALIRVVTRDGSLRDRTVIILLLHTGLRVGELCQLRRGQIILGKRSGTLTIIGKRNKQRTVPLNATARAVFAEYLPTIDQEPNTIVFPSERTGHALGERAIGYLIAKYVKKANISNLHPHDLRHRFGYRMAESVPLHRLAQIMGHDSLDTTMIYVRGTQQDLQTEVEKIAWR